jgi:hypothetical protein
VQKILYFVFLVVSINFISLLNYSLTFTFFQFSCSWGDGARLAARCAIRGAIDHLNGAIERHQLHNTNEIFHSLLGAFHAAHALILQEGGALTTLCVALVAPVRQSNSSVRFFENLINFVEYVQ